MDKLTLKDINDQVFDFLLERHYEAKEQGRPESFLFVMTTDETRLQEGLWLPGDEGSLIVSFLTRSGGEAAVYLTITPETDSPVALVLSMSNQLNKALELAPIVRDESLAQALDLKPAISNNTQYQRGYLSSDYLAILARFIEKEKDYVDSTVGRFSTLLKDKSFSLGQSIELKQFYEQFQTVQQRRMAIEPRLNWSKKALPYALQSLFVRNFRGVKSLPLGPLPLDAQWIFVTGKNGFGKSSLLQAIALGLWGVRDSIDREWADNKATVQSTFKAADDGLFYNDIDYQRYTFSYLRVIHGHLATYGSSRLQTNPTITGLESDSGGQFATLYHLFNNDGSLLAVDKWLTDLHAYDKLQFKQLVNLLKSLIPALHSVEVKYDTVRSIPQAIFYEKDDTEDGKNNHHYDQGVPFKQLASGFQNIIALVADMLRRLSLTRSVKSYKELSGIVIIDELELHLHPSLQRELPKKLSELFPHVQFIASTHSPIPLLGAPKETIILTVDRTESTGVTVELLDVDFSKLLPNAILTSPIFGFEDIIAESAAGVGEVYTSDSYDKVQIIQEMEDQLGVLRSRMNDE